MARTKINTDNFDRKPMGTHEIKCILDMRGKSLPKMLELTADDLFHVVPDRTSIFFEMFNHTPNTNLFILKFEGKEYIVDTQGCTYCRYVCRLIR